MPSGSGRVLHFDENHSWSTYSKTKSRLIGFYTSIVLTATTILAAVLVKEHVDIILHGEITFDDSIFFYGTTFFYVSCQIVPFFTFLEKKKINNFFRLWRHFEFQYFVQLKKWPQINIQSKLKLKLAMVLITISANALTFLILTYSSRIRFYSKQYYYLIFSIMSVYHSILTTTYALFWFYSTKALKFTTRNFLLNLKACDDIEKIENFRCIWVILKDLTLSLGNSFSSTFTWVLTFNLIFVLSAVYFCINRLVLGFVSKGWIPTLFGVLYLNLFGQCAYEAVDEVGNKSKRLLFIMLSTEKNKKKREHLKWFINTLSASPPTISLSGNMILNREFNLGMINTVIAYMIVFFQFKMMEESELNCSV